MAKVRRATFFFPALEVNPIQINSQTEDVNELTNLRVWITDFPLVFDPVLVVVRPPESFEELAELQKLPQNTPLDANGTPNRTGKYSASQYFIGVALNDIIIHDGVFKIVDGIKAEFVQDAAGSNSNPNSLPKSRGLVKIDTSKINFGVLDNVKIVVMKANTYSPWLYYGSIPERAALANKDDRFIASQGAIFPLDESEIIQAAGMRYFVDVFKSQISGLSSIGTLTFAPIFYGASDINSSISDLFFMGDVLDGDGSLGYRSFITFKVLQIQESLELGGIEIPALAVQRADAFKTIDYRSLEYQKTTNKIKKSISESNYYFLNDTDEAIIPYYKIVSMGFPFISEFIDFDTTFMSVSLQNLINSPATIASQFDSLVAFPLAISGLITTAEQVIENDIGTFKKICVVFSDLITELNDETAKTNLQKATSQFISKFSNRSDIRLKLVLFITDNNKKQAAINLANSTFGQPNVILTETQTVASLGWLHFVGVLLKTAGIVASENVLVESEKGINANTLKQNMLRITKSSGVSSGTDFDRDGTISLLDLRHYDLTTKFKPTATQNTLTSFLGDPISEMIFWKKISPIGQLFNFIGTVQSTDYLSGGNIMLTVKIKWPSNATQPEPKDNIIKVLVEYAAKTNLNDLTGEIEFQGRLFYPGYMINTSINNVIKFNTTREISAWFRVFSSTAQQIINFGSSNNTKEEPLIIIRSNYFSSSGGQNQNSVSKIFTSPNATSTTVSSLSLVSGPDEVNDYLNLFGNDSRILLKTETPCGVDKTIDLFDSGNTDVVFSNIKFDIIVPETEKPPSPDNEDNEGLIGDFEYELQYKAQGVPQQNGQDVYNTLDKFFSVTVFDGDIVDNKRIFTINVDPGAIKTLICKETVADFQLPQDSPEKGKEFNITYNYPKKNDGTDYIWTWKPEEWSFVIKKNNKILNDADFEIPPVPPALTTTPTQGSPSPPVPSQPVATGSFKLKNKINLQEDVLVAEFINIAANQKGIKIGSKLRLKGVSGPAIDPPKFNNLKVNFSSEKSIERVECHFSSTAQGDSFYLTTPANGFVSLSGYGWSFEQEVGTERSGFTDSTRIIGNLTGPTLYFDAFSNSIEEKTISKSTLDPRFFPTVDIVFSNVVNTFGIPFMEILAILFDIPPPPDIDRFASVRSRITEKLTLVFNTENFLQQKYSFTNFVDYNTDDGWDFMKTSLRKNIPIYSEIFSKADLNFSTSGNEIIIDVANPESAATQGENTEQAVNADKILVAIGIEANIQKDIIDITTNETVNYELQGSVDGLTFVPFGYTNGLNESLSLIITIKDLKNIYFQIPDTTLKGFTKLKLVPIESSSTITPIKIIGSFIGSYTVGRSPAVFETNFGEYILFFVRDITSINQKQLVALVSLQDGQTWHRPSVSSMITVQAQDEKGNKTTSVQPNPQFENPIIVLTGYSSPVLLKSNIADTFYIFVFNSRVLPGTIEMVEMERALFFKLEEDNSSSASDLEVETPDETQTSLVNTDEVISYARVFKANALGNFNHVKTVLKKASNIYTVELLKTGDLYCALLDSSGQFRVKYNRALGGGSIDTSFNWEDLGINLLDTTTDNGDGTKGSYLSKVANNSNIGALTLKYSYIEDILWLFVSTSNSAALNPGRLFLIKLPEAIIKPPALKTNPNDNEKHIFEGEELTDTELDKKFQVTFNRIKPILSFGKKEGLNPEFIEINNNGTVDDFPSQIIAVEWLENGDGQIYFVFENNIKSRITKSSGLYWADYSNI